MGLAAVTTKIEIGATADEVFRFVTDAARLTQAFPRFLHAAVRRRGARQLGPGATLELGLRAFGFSFRAELAVTTWRPSRQIAYVWRNGAFRPWEHDLYFEPLSATRCRVTHCVLYRPPWGVAGLVFDRLWFRAALRRALFHLGPSWEAAVRDPPFG